eukprot:10607609-Ditylum_brightwellii.AAC.1
MAEGYVDDCDAGTADQHTQQMDTPDIITERMREKCSGKILKWLLGNLMDQEVNAEFWMAALQAGIVVTASDGSVKEGRGTYAVIFKAGDSEL